jgi:ATP-dependent DNA helicase RecG
MKEIDLLTKIQLGEDSFTEFKSENVHNDSLAKSFVAFANTSGGSVFVGVADDGTIEGVIDKNFQEKIIQICRNSIQPSIIPLVEKHLVLDKTILEIKIAQGNHKPYKVKTTNHYYIRAGNTSMEPTREELARLFQSGGLLHFELVALQGHGKEFLDTLRFRDYCESYRETEFPEWDKLDSFLQNLQILNYQNELTILGGLFFSKSIYPSMPQAGIQMYRFGSLDRTGEILDQKDMYATIPECIESALKFVQENSKIKAIFKESDIKRYDVPEYDSLFVRELLANAFCHRDWSIYGQRIRLFLYEDRLEIFSPGGLPNTMTLNSALSGVSFYRNPAISQICKDYGFVEKAGRGLAKIMKKCKLENIPEPKFECTPNYVQVVLPKNV